IQNIAKIVILALVFLFAASFVSAAKKSKWQAMLERNSVPEIYWQKYLPKVSRQEYRKAVKNFQKDQSAGESATGSGDIKIVEGKHPLPANSGKIAREQHL